MNRQRFYYPLLRIKELNMKKFIITIDTEGDNLWDWKPGNVITTENALYLKRFQNLANKYAFKPVWLSNYEMIADDRYVEFITEVEDDNTGELGMHLHAWSTPPDFALDYSQTGAPYLIEYPTNIMEEKICNMTSFIKERTGITPISHRSGRWAMDDRYFELLAKYGYKIDCSVTPHRNWSTEVGQSMRSVGVDYSNYQEIPYFYKEILEVPVSIRKTNHFFLPTRLTLRKIVGATYRAIKGEIVWLRPTGSNLNQMLWLINHINNSDADYIMFMLHSSEMMPGGSPTFKTEADIEKMYSDVENVFSVASKKFEGCTLREYHNSFNVGRN